MNFGQNVRARSCAGWACRWHGRLARAGCNKTKNDPQTCGYFLLASPARAGRPCHNARRGAILITTIWVTVILGAMLLVFARSMRVELVTAANRLDYDQADAVELGAEQYVLATCDNTDGEAEYILNQPGEALQVGSGYFWLLRPSQQNEQSYDFGITDECSKLNLNFTADGQSPASRDLTINLPGMTTQAADSIVDWIDTDENVTGGDGAESQFYMSLPEPYKCKNQPLETPEELLLVQGVDQTLLYGIDRNRNGVIEPAELTQGAAPVTNSNGVSANRGIFPFITVFTAEPNVDLQGNQRVDVNPATGGQNTGNSNASSGANKAGNSSGASPSGAGNRSPQKANGNANAQGGGSNQNLVQVLSTVLSSSRAQQIASAAQSRGPFSNIFDFAQKTNMQPQEIQLVADKITFTSQASIPGLINVNTAPREVLLCLPGLQESDVDGLITARQSADTSSVAWVAQAMTMSKAAQIGQYITSRSFFYSANIVAVSGDGRSFKREYIVVDARQSPAKIIYRKDLTQYGWPLPEDIRTSLRMGRGVGQSWEGMQAPAQPMLQGPK
ncbi:MAG TPA: hypothetical protein VN541_20205 [Tepidisphaeraceae bacterium]|nr:hypothetical protein [Tepidisphaeraceae bacterium]